MPIKVIRRDGRSEDVIAQAGQSLMEAIRDAGIDELQAMCGGCCSCATCHVYVEAEYLGDIPSINDDEDDLLDSSAHRNQQSRLACQIVYNHNLDGMTVVIAPED